MLREYQKSECPNCGTPSLYTETATADQATVFDTGAGVKPGQRVTRCDTCGEIVKTAAPAKPKGRRSSSGKPAKRSKRKLRDRVRRR